MKWGLIKIIIKTDRGKSFPLSDYISGKCEPTLKVAREINRKLNIDANIILGV